MKEISYFSNRTVPGKIYRTVISKRTFSPKNFVLYRNFEPYRTASLASVTYMLMHFMEPARLKLGAVCYFGFSCTCGNMWLSGLYL